MHCLPFFDWLDVALPGMPAMEQELMAARCKSQVLQAEKG
jgi:hypothetical protein